MLIEFLLAAFILVVAWKFKSRKDLPPGPWLNNLPLLGYLPFMGKWPHLAFSKMAKQYGPIYGLQFGSTYVVVINSYDVLYETFVKRGKIFSDRPKDNTLKNATEKVFAGENGWEWHQHRKFVDKFLKTHGVGSANSEMKIMVELQQFLDRCEQRRLNNDKVKTSFENDLVISIVNNTCTLLFGQRFDYEDSSFKQIIRNENQLTQLYESANIELYLPLYAHILKLLKLKSGLQMIRFLGKKFDRFMERIINEHETNPKCDFEEDYISAFLQEKQGADQSEHAQKLFTKPWLLGILHNMYGGALETTFQVLHFAILAMIRNPNVQKEIHQELDEVIGSRTVNLLDRSSTPLTCATLLEIHRLITPVLLGLPHLNNEEVVIQGYRFPKDTCIIPNLWHIHRDPALWEDPHEFQPRRFIVDGKLVKPPHLITFGVGKRSCPGEVLSNSISYMYFVSLMQRYEFYSNVPIKDLPLLEPNALSLVSACTPFEMSFNRRS